MIHIKKTPTEWMPESEEPKKKEDEWKKKLMLGSCEYKREIYGNFQANETNDTKLLWHEKWSGHFSLFTF